MTAHRQTGLSLIELMVAIALGVMVLFGVLQIYLSGSDNAAFNHAQQQNQANARFILDLLQRESGRAGYSAWVRHATAADDQQYDFVIDREGPFPALTDSATGCTFDAGKGTSLDAGGRGLCLRYQRPQRSEAQVHQDCTGAPLYSDDDAGNPQVLVSHLRLVDGELLCKTNNALSTGEVALASGIHDLMFAVGSTNQLRAGLVLTSSRALLPENCTYQDPLNPATTQSTGARGLCNAFTQTLYLRNQP
ncbi:prepilin-type N-terminal cleavage/methylation domain-containing protein [Pseudomonas sp. PDM33]|uniref:PilW family protein n=1 Tax=Pseudomonas sp. PDM33 TaxID=2854765 RepID=UPI001C46E76E|nr:prepilin-type N-terminal cleavage/methylation domain-containing protein [Pseudomonas sp. PDM33]MBV7586755.1 prepilin-type N-terminal cleavage/methylation domain-containing protein [Pseudomonas sp. PDM33]